MSVRFLCRTSPAAKRAEEGPERRGWYAAARHWPPVRGDELSVRQIADESVGFERPLPERAFRIPRLATRCQDRSCLAGREAAQTATSLSGIPATSSTCLCLGSATIDLGDVFAFLQERAGEVCQRLGIVTQDVGMQAFDI